MVFKFVLVVGIKDTASSIFFFISCWLNYTVACPNIRRHVFEKETLNPLTGMKKEENLYLSDHSITCCFKKSETKIGGNEYLSVSFRI